MIGRRRSAAVGASTRMTAQVDAQVTTRRTIRILLGCTAAVAVLATVFGYTITDAAEQETLPPPAAAVVLPVPPEVSGVPDTDEPPTGPSPGGDGGSAPTTPPTPGSPSASGPAGTGPATTGPDGNGSGGNGSGDAGRDDTGPGPAAPTTPPTAVPPPTDDGTTAPPPPPPPPPTPRVVGATSLAGFDSFLDDYCDQRGFRGALLINGRRTPETGRWVCARFGDLDTIDVDDACQDTFGSSSRARATVSGDIRTVRCFDF